MEGSCTKLQSHSKEIFVGQARKRVWSSGNNQIEVMMCFETLFMVFMLNTVAESFIFA